MNLEPKDIIQIILTIISIIVAIRIPVRISWNQRYENMAATYQSIEFAAALQNVISFYYHVCDCDVTRIHAEYKKIFLKDFPDYNSLNFNGDSSQVLHYQRRFLVEFFCEMDICARHSRSLRKLIQKEYTEREANLIKILMYMDKALDNDSDMFMNIKSISNEHFGRAKGINAYLSHLASLLKDTGKQMKF